MRIGPKLQPWIVVSNHGVAKPVWFRRRNQAILSEAGIRSAICYEPSVTHLSSRDVPVHPQPQQTLMPILAIETSIYPNELLDGAAKDDERNWCVVRTKARQEKALARELVNRETSFYLPLIPKDQVIRGRHVQSHLPIFSGYVFVKGSDEERGRVMSSRRVSSVIPVHDETQLVRDLHQVRTLIECDAPLTIEGRLVAGDRVRVKHGAMQGIEGVIIRRDNGNRLLVAVSYMQQGVSIQIDDYMVEPL